MKNNLFKIILVNIVSILVILFVVEFSLNVMASLESIQTMKNKELSVARIIEDVKETMYHQYRQEYSEKFYNYNDFRENKIKPTNSPAVLFIGCSYTYGLELDYNDTISSKYADLTNRTTYNLGLPGGGPKEFLHILRNKSLLKQLNIDTNNIEYVVYVYINDHQRRLFTNARVFGPKYKEENGVLKEKHINTFFERTRIKNAITHYYFHHIIRKFFEEYSWQKTERYIKEINKEIKNTFTNHGKETKFIILSYKELNNEDWSNLEKENIQIIRVKTLTDINLDEVPYIVWEGNDHPSALAWDIILPKFIKEINTANTKNKTNEKRIF